MKAFPITLCVIALSFCAGGFLNSAHAAGMQCGKASMQRKPAEAARPKRVTLTLDSQMSEIVTVFFPKKDDKFVIGLADSAQPGKGWEFTNIRQEQQGERRYDCMYLELPEARVVPRKLIVTVQSWPPMGGTCALLTHANSTIRAAVFRERCQAGGPSPKGNLALMDYQSVSILVHPR